MAHPCIMAKKNTANGGAFPLVLLPRSVVRLIRADPTTPAWNSEVGRIYRVGYYNRYDGFQTVWLVDDDGVTGSAFPSTR
jgi:hypothetical protein